MTVRPTPPQPGRDHRGSTDTDAVETSETERPPPTQRPSTPLRPTTAAAGAEPALGEFQAISGVPGVTDETIGFAVLGTGPANPLGYCLLECYQGGVQAYFDYRNSLGGVHGRQLEITQVADDEMGNTQVKALELIEADDVFAVFGAPLLYNGYSDLGNAGMPLYTTFPASPSAVGFDSIYTPTGTICTSCPRRMTVLAASLGGGTKAASLGLGASEASKECVANNEAAFAKWGPEVGVEFVYKNDTLPFGFPNGLGPEVTAMKDLGVDFIVTCVDQNSVVTLEQELERQGIGSDVTVVLPQGYGDSEFLESNADLLEGDIIGTAIRPVESVQDGTMLPTMLEWLEQGGHKFNDYFLQGWVGADLAVTGILAAGPGFDRAKVVAATNSITDYTAGGLIQPTDWSRQHNPPTPDDPVSNGPVYDCQTFLQVRGGKLELLGDADKPFFCFDPSSQDWVEPTSMSF